MFIVVRIRKGIEVIKDWFGAKVAAENVSLADVYDLYRSGAFDHKPPVELGKAVLNVFIGQKKTELTQVSPDITVGEAAPCLGNFIDFSVTEPENETNEKGENDAKMCAYKILMSAANKSNHLPAMKAPQNQKARLFNDILSWLKTQNVGFVSTNVSTLGNQLLNCVADIMWYISGNHDTLADRACSIPEPLRHLDNYYDSVKRKRKKVDKDNLKEEGLRNHSAALLLLCEKSFFQREMWKAVKEVLVSLGDCLHRYADYIAKKKAAPSESKQIKAASDRESFEVLGQKTHILPGPASRYQALHTAISMSDPYEKICLNDYAPGDPRRRFDYVKGLIVPVKCIKFTYSGSKEHLIFLWKVDVTHSESEILSQNMKIVTELRPTLPVYHTRAMRREFLSLFGRQIHGKSGFFREAYRRLTGDASASININTAEADKRISDILEMEDPDLICDLRVNNTGQPEKYETFLQECQKHIASSLETAVDDRRHDKVGDDGDVVTHFADAFSVRDLYDQVAKKCPPDAPMPSKQWLKLQFWPRNCHNKSSVRYNGKLKIKFMIQSRQFRKSHEDMHYASAIFRYEKEFCLKFKEYCNLICVDDKHKVKVGEPGYPVATVDRGKEVLVSMGKVFEVGDHDFTKLSITPSVALNVKIPKSIEETFYGGDVYVYLKESAFEPSSPWRHSAELQQILDASKPIVAIYSDGGPDHRVTYGSVQISMINLFLAGDYDMVLACRTPPSNSWKNPAERIMSILNLGFQSVGLMRQSLDDDVEKKLSSISSTNQLRDFAEKSQFVEGYIKDSMSPVKTLLYDVISRLKWKDSNLKGRPAATSEEISDLAGFVNRIEQIDPFKTTQKDLKVKAVYKKFVDTHCQIKHYMFSVKKCGLATCGICKPPRLPVEKFETLSHLPDPMPGDGEKFKSFEEVYNTETTEKFRPSLKQGHASDHGMPFPPSSQYGKNVQMVVICSQCEKPRVLFSKTVVRNQARVQLQQSLADLEYSCGSSFVDVECEDTHVLKRVFVRKNLKCNDTVEFAYYTSGFENVCYYCGNEDCNEAEGSYPLCENCQEDGKKFFPRRKRLAASAKK